MVFGISKGILYENITKVLKAIPTKPSQDILKCIYIEAYDNAIRLTANDLELAIETDFIPCSVIEEGEICVDAKLFSDIIRHLKDGLVHIKTLDNKNILIKCEKAEFKINYFDADQFPKMPLVIKENKYVISSTKLKNMIRQTIFAVSVDTSKMVLTGELLDFGENFHLVGLDGFKVAIRNSDYVGSDIETKIVVPSKTLSELSKIIETEYDLEIYVTDKHVLFNLLGTTLLSRVIEGEFVNYEQVTPKDYTTKIIVNRQEFIKSIDRITVIISEIKKNPIKLSINKEVLVLTVNNETGTTYEELDIDFEGNEMQVAFNPRYLLEILKALDEEEVEMLFTTNLSACIIRDRDAIDHTYLLLPLRIRD